MSFDDRIRDSLIAAADAHHPGPPPIDELAANVRRRRRTRYVAAGLASVVGVMVAISLVATLTNSSTPKQVVNAADPGGAGRAPGASPTGTTTPGKRSTSTTAARSSVSPSGSGHASPASTVIPSPTSTTLPHTSTTTTPPSTGDTVSVTQADDGKTFTLRRGQHLVVTLDDPSWQWSEPDTDKPSVLARTAVSANPSSTHVTASFDAEGAGQAHVSASKDAPCRNAQPPCMVPTYLWQITVNVV